MTRALSSAALHNYSASGVVVDGDRFPGHLTNGTKHVCAVRGVAHFAMTPSGIVSLQRYRETFVAWRVIVCCVVSLYPLWWWHFGCSVATFLIVVFFTYIAAISEQCGVSRLFAAAVLPMVNSAADFNTCSTDVHLSLAAVLVFTSEMESDTAARNIARYGSFTSKSV